MTGLDNGTVYHYKIFARDTNRNYAIGVVPTGSPVTPTVTTLGDGTPVSNATIAPGGAATMADAFAFQTGSGTDTITAITVTLASGTSAAVSLVEITDVAGDHRLRIGQQSVQRHIHDHADDQYHRDDDDYAVQDPRHAEEPCGDAGAPRNQLRADSPYHRLDRHQRA